MKNSKWLFICLSFIAGTWIFEACNNGQPANSTDSVEAAKETNDSSNLIAVDEDDTEFVLKAADGGMAEVEMGNLGKEKATNPSIKEYAANMVADHTKANEELKALAASKNITLPASVSEYHQEHLTKLSEKKTNEFDKDYIDMMVDDHQKTVDLFEKQSKEGKDADLKAFATNTLPTLRSHLDAAKALKDNIK